MVLIGIGAVLALLPAFLALRAKARHDRVIRLIHETPVTPIAELVQSSKADPAVPILVAVQGHVVARKTTRLTAPITGRSCVAYNVHALYKWSELGEPEENHIGDSTWVPWAVDDGTGPALAPFDPLEHRFGFVDGWQPRYRWPRTESSGDTFKNTPRQLERVISHYGRWRLPSPEGLLPDSSDRKDLSWKVRILKEFGNKVFLLTKTFKIIKKVDGGSPVYQRNPLEGLGITLANFEVKLFDYTDKVRAQIGTQQTALMAVATARAKAQQAEQEALMAEAEGKANVARAKYEEEEKKIRAVVGAQQRLEVADLDRQAAAEKKQEQILLGQGEAERKRLVLKADGALKQKLEAYVQAQKLWANAFAQRQVPSLVMGGGGAGDTDKSTTNFAQMMQLLVANQMGLDLSVPKGAISRQR